MNVVFDVLIAILFRWGVAIGPHSGQSKPPMYGDYEAQRHWMEITYNLPIKDWYFNTTDNDLMYWGLDYPPLTAYHSWLMGYIAGNFYNQSWVELFNSRGMETYEHRLFMRYTVLFCDLLIYIPAIIVYVSHVMQPKTSRVKNVLIISMLMYPGLILIDYGHFQYNVVSLGLFIWAVTAVIASWNCTAAVLFVLALNYKQMELYHAVPFFCYFLGLCLKRVSTWHNALVKLCSIAFSTLTTFAVCWLPFLNDIEQLKQLLHRIFPFYRGLYEDKVANFWCSSSVLIKWNEILPLRTMLNLSTVCTGLLLLPSAAMLFHYPSKGQFRIALINSALVFFLFSFQVHEKTILLVAIPVLLCLKEHVLECTWFLLMSVISMYPLFVKDGIQIALYALTIPYYVWMCDMCCISIWRSSHVTGAGTKTSTSVLNWKVVTFHVTVLIGLLLCMLKALVTPPPRLPYLFDLLISAYCCGMFCVFGLISHYWQYKCIGPISKLKKTN